MRVRVVEADDFKAALSRRPPCVDVAFRIEPVPIGIFREIDGPDGFDDFAAGAQQHTAAFGGQGFAGMRGDLVHHEARESNTRCYNASTAIAMPMPPPTHSAATPYRIFLARSAWTSVVSTRAPLAPIGCPSAMAPP
jgi:hypothetical protein